MSYRDDYGWLMSVEELKKTVATLSPGEQNELTAFLFHLRQPWGCCIPRDIEGSRG